jgi:tetratricopeptide (TPR) repeat protein
MLIGRYMVVDYDKADSKLNLFYADMLNSDFSAARRRIDGAISLWPWNSRYYTWRGYMFGRELPFRCLDGFHGAMSVPTGLDQQAARDALADYHRALELNSRDAVAYHNQAWLEHLLGDDETAAKDWHEATLLDPLNAIFHLSYGLFLQDKGQSEIGTSELEAAIELSPSILDSPFFRQYREHSPAMAKSLVARCISKMEAKLLQGSDPILEARLGKLYQFSGNFRRSVELLHDAVENLPNLALVWFNLGEAHASLGDIQNATDCYKKANVIDNTLGGPYLRMGEMYLKAGQTQLAARYLRQAAGQWERVTPFTASHNNRLYVGPRQKIDDLLPTTLLWCVTQCEISDAYRDLEELSPPNERARYRARVNSCEQIPSPHLWP